MIQKKTFELISQNIHILKNALEQLNSFLMQSDTFFELLNLIVKNKGNIVLSGVGKSGFALRKITASFNSYGIRSSYIDSNESFHGDLGIISTNSIVILASISGETEEVIRLNSHLISNGIKPFVFTANIKSKLSRNSNRTIIIPSVKEICSIGLAPTTSYFVLVSALEILFSIAGKIIGIKIDDFKLNHPSGLIGKKLNLTVDEVMSKGNNLPFILKKSSVFESLIEMNSKSLGIVCIVDKEHHIEGIFTDGDLRRFFTNRKNPYAETISDNMTKHPIKVLSGSLAIEALKLLTIKKINTLPVTDSSNRLIGILRLIDLYDYGFNYEQN